MKCRRSPGKEGKEEGDMKDGEGRGGDLGGAAYIQPCFVNF